jgi:hypothetical protein
MGTTEETWISRKRQVMGMKNSNDYTYRISEEGCAQDF